MPYFTEIRTIICFVENHVKESQIIDKQLEHAVGFSIPHIREIFRAQAVVPLKQYIIQRKIANSTFDLLYSKDRVLDIALSYGFESHETYARAFKRVLGITPMDYRKRRPVTAREIIVDGVYGINVHGKSLNGFYLMDEKRMEKKNDRTVLYGVPKVGYGVYGYTPYAVCLKACSNYLGEDVEYNYTMVSSGAAFRMCWNTKEWDLSNVDIYHTFEESNDIYGIGAKALGRKFDILVRDRHTTKEEFLDFIKSHIDQGYPCIALGIIGPPEAGIVAGYEEGGNKLLGFSFFQEDPGFAGTIEFSENGYYVCDSWWNDDTQAVMCMGDIVDEKMTFQSMLQNGIRALTGRTEGNYSKGILAYDAWKSFLGNDAYFSEHVSEGLIHERLMCQHDAMSCLMDGRGNASCYFYQHASDFDENKEKMYAISKAFDTVFHFIKEMEDLLGGFSHSEECLAKFKDKENRKKLCALIDQAKAEDEKALLAMKELLM